MPDGSLALADWASAVCTDHDVIDSAPCATTPSTTATPTPHEGPAIMTRHARGSMMYSAPESLLAVEASLPHTVPPAPGLSTEAIHALLTSPDHRVYPWDARKADAWSLGVCIYSLLVNGPIYMAATWLDPAFRGFCRATGQFEAARALRLQAGWTDEELSAVELACPEQPWAWPACVPAWARDVIAGLLCVDPHKRTPLPVLLASAELRATMPTMPAELQAALKTLAALTSGTCNWGVV